MHTTIADLLREVPPETARLARLIADPCEGEYATTCLTQLGECLSVLGDAEIGARDIDPGQRDDAARDALWLLGVLTQLGEEAGW